MADRMVKADEVPGSEDANVTTSVQRRRHWTMPEKVCLVEETRRPIRSVSLVARDSGLNGNQLLT
jgi:transposase